MIGNDTSLMDNQHHLFDLQSSFPGHLELY